MNGRIRVLALVAIGAGVATVACSKSKKPLTKADVAEASSYYKQNCAVCHGADGKGDGPGGANLIPKPQDFADAKWQARIKDDELAKAILKGGLAVGRSPLMPSHPDLEKKPEIVRGLVRLIRGFKK